MYKKDDLVVLAANPYHIGLVRQDQAGSRESVLVEWMRTPPVWMQPHEIILEAVHHALHPAQSYDILEPIFEEQSLWIA